MVTVADLPSSYTEREQGLAVDGQKRVLLAGASVMRLTESGSLDPSFGSGGRAPLPVQATQYQPLPARWTAPTDRSSVARFPTAVFRPLRSRG